MRDWIKWRENLVFFYSLISSILLFFYVVFAYFVIVLVWLLLFYFKLSDSRGKGLDNLEFGREVRPNIK
jgi:hypothetical protein